MTQRVEAETPLFACSRIAQPACDQPVGNFVKDDCDDQRRDQQGRKQKSFVHIA